MNKTSFEADIRKILKKHKRIVESLKKELRYVKLGKLYIKRNRNKVYYYEYLRGSEKSISSNKDKLRALARVELVRAHIKILEFNIDAIEKALNKMKPENTKHSNELFDLLCVPAGIYTKAQVEWMTEPYQRNPYHPEHLRYSSTNGVLLRSKSEQAIANRLEARGIPYRAEPPMNIAGRIMYSDFVILLDEKEIKIWEHFGLMDDEEYRQNAMDKIEDYRKSGFVQHKNLICTREEDIQSADDIDQIIDRFLIR